jgi:hypothetical protein
MNFHGVHNFLDGKKWDCSSQSHFKARLSIRRLRSGIVRGRILLATASIVSFPLPRLTLYPFAPSSLRLSCWYARGVRVNMLRIQ